MQPTFRLGPLFPAISLSVILAATTVMAQDAGTALPLARPGVPAPAGGAEQVWNWHVQNTDIVESHGDFPAPYTGPNSLGSQGQVRETVSLDWYGSLRLWSGAEAHLDTFFWQGQGFSHGHGAEAFPDGESIWTGPQAVDVNLAHLFVRQTFGFGGGQEDIPDDQLTLAGKEDINRLTITVGRMSAKDIFDNNAYANDPRTQFLNYALMANQAWDFPEDALGYITGATAELNQPDWSGRYGWFQVPQVAGGVATDHHLLSAWAMVAELERRYSSDGRTGTIRFLAFLNRAPMGRFSDALGVSPAAFPLASPYRCKYGFGLNWDQELTEDLGAFARLGWNDGKTQAWMFSDVNYAASVGLSIKGSAWNRADDTVGLAGVYNGIGRSQRAYLAAGGTGILNGDGVLTYGGEQVLETYYSLLLHARVKLTLDYQFIDHPAFNTARGPVSVFGARLHLAY